MLKSEGIFLICNESDGTNAADEKWTKMINGMKIYTSKQLVAALKEAGFTEIKNVFKCKKSLDKYCCNEIANFQLEEETKIIHVLCHIVSVYFLEVYQVTWHLSYLHYHLSLLFHNTST